MQAFSLLAATQELDLVLNAITDSAAISPCETAQQWHQALELLVPMLAAHLLPDVITYNTAISAREKAQRWYQALGPPGGDAAGRVAARCYHLLLSHQRLCGPPAMAPGTRSPGRHVDQL